MQKDDREKSWKATAKNSADLKKSMQDADISNLNIDNDFEPVDEEEKAPLTEEEKIDIRKKLFMLLMIIIVALFIMVIMLFFSPSNSSSKKDDKDDDQTEVDENKDEDKEEVDPVDLPLTQLPDGAITNGNVELNRLIDEVVYNYYELYDKDTVSLFKNDSVDIATTSNSNKLLLASKTTDFQTVLTDIVKDRENLCSESIVIPTSTMAKILEERLKTTVTKYENFVYSYYDEEDYVSNIRFVLEGDNYVGSCYTATKDVKEISEQSFLSATKEENNVYLDFQVAFINLNGVYKDPNFKTLITDDTSVVSTQYMQQANTYRYTFDISDNYSLTNIKLLK